MKVKIERFNKELQRELSYIFQTEVRNKNLSFITINAVEITNDLSHAKVYYTSLKEIDRKELEKELRDAEGYIRKNLYDRVNMRKIPLLHFQYDDSIEYGMKIEKKIKELTND